MPARAPNVVSLEAGTRCESLDPWDVEPFIRVPIALSLLGLRATHRCVYHALCFRWWRNRNTAARGVTVASLRQLSVESGVTVKEVRGAVAALTDVGWVFRKTLSGQRTAFVARPLPAELMAQARSLARLGDGALELSSAFVHGLIAEAEADPMERKDCQGEQVSRGTVRQ